MQAYQCKNRAIAGSLGAQNYKKLSGLATVFADDKGVTVEKLLHVAMARAIESPNSKWWELTASVLNIHDPKAPQMTVNNFNQNNTQINVDGEAVENFNKQFKEWINSQ